MSLNPAGEIGILRFQACDPRFGRGEPRILRLGGRFGQIRAGIEEVALQAVAGFGQGFHLGADRFVGLAGAELTPGGLFVLQLLLGVGGASLRVGEQIVVGFEIRGAVEIDGLFGEELRERLRLPGSGRVTAISRIFVSRTFVTLRIRRFIASTGRESRRWNLSSALTKRVSLDASSSDRKS